MNGIIYLIALTFIADIICCETNERIAELLANSPPSNLNIETDKEESLEAGRFRDVCGSIPTTAGVPQKKENDNMEEEVDKIINPLNIQSLNRRSTSEKSPTRGSSAKLSQSEKLLVNRTSKSKINIDSQDPPLTKKTSIDIIARGDEKLLSRSLTLDKKAEKSVNQKVINNAPQIQNNTEVVAQVGGTATLSCYTSHISDEVVTWLKREDDQLLTIGQELYANEARFSASLSHTTKAWELFVRDVQLSDAGQYECQLTTHPPVTFLFSLKVKQAKAEITGPREVHIEEGSQLDLHCIVKESPNPPVYIFWYHNGTMVNYESQRGLQVHLENFISSLVVSKVTPSDAGIYTCDPHLATRASVIVHVVTGEKPAAMQHGRNPVNGSGSMSSRFESSRQCSVYFLFSLLFPTFLLQVQSYFLYTSIHHSEIGFQKRSM